MRKYGSVLFAISSASLACFAAIRSFSPSTLCTSMTMRPTLICPTIIGKAIFETMSAPSDAGFAITRISTMVSASQAIPARMPAIQRRSAEVRR
ncbi:hypothetical protein D3C72_2230550 [compost metagenome]